MYHKYLPRCLCPERCGSTFITINGFRHHVALKHGQWMWTAALVRRYAHEAKNQWTQDSF